MVENKSWQTSLFLTQLICLYLYAMGRGGGENIFIAADPAQPSNQDFQFLPVEIEFEPEGYTG